MANVLAPFSATLRIRLADEAGMFGGVEASSRARQPLAEILRRRTLEATRSRRRSARGQFRGFELARR